MLEIHVKQIKLIQRKLQHLKITAGRIVLPYTLIKNQLYLTKEKSEEIKKID